jgi:predicted enzyme involved in methoxymalonyl-ACP biosynthesis
MALRHGGAFARARGSQKSWASGVYERNAQRVALKNSVGDVEAYYASLDMEIQFAPFDQIGRSRIVQFINKSNQFNLTTRRHTEPRLPHWSRILIVSRCRFD